MVTLRRLCSCKFSNVFLGFATLMMILVLFDYLRGLRTTNVDVNHPHSRRKINQNQQVCRYPLLTLKEDTLAENFHRMPPLRCHGHSLMYLKNGVLHINDSVLVRRKIDRCIYRAIDRPSDFSAEFSKPHTRTKAPFGIRIKHDFFRVECYLQHHKENRSSLVALKTTTEIPDFDDDSPEILADYDHFFAQIVPNSEASDRAEAMTEKKMNVLFISINSMSHLSFQRKLPKTYKYINNLLDSVIFDGFNVVGDGSTPNMVAMMTGKKIKSLQETRRNVQRSTYVDKFPFIWYDYEQAGYVTLFAEDDDPALGTFQSELNGFEQAPTDHYFRTFWLSAWNSALHKRSPHFCLGNKPNHQYLLDYVKEFFTKYPKSPKFAVVSSGELSRWNNNPAEYLDHDLVQFLDFMKKEGFLDNTVVVIGADHGSRFSQVRHTFQGKLEERLPMMSVSFPPAFKHKYPVAFRTMEQNKAKLTTPYDVYETLKDVLDLSRLTTPISSDQLGISLLRPIPGKRTCGGAGVPPHFCTCARFTKLPGGGHAQKAPREVVRYINEMLKNANTRGQCLSLSLDKIAVVLEVIPNEMILKYVESVDSKKTSSDKAIPLETVMYQMIIHTRPNHGVYEASVTVNKSKQHYTVVGISRTNSFGTDPHCIAASNPELKRFCYCKRAYVHKNNEGMLGLDVRRGKV